MKSIKAGEEAFKNEEGEIVAVDDDDAVVEDGIEDQDSDAADSEEDDVLTVEEDEEEASYESPGFNEDQDTTPEDDDLDSTDDVEESMDDAPEDDDSTEDEPEEEEAMGEAEDEVFEPAMDDSEEEDVLEEVVEPEEEESMEEESMEEDVVEESMEEDDVEESMDDVEGDDVDVITDDTPEEDDVEDAGCGSPHSEDETKEDDVEAEIDEEDEPKGISFDVDDSVELPVETLEDDASLSESHVDVVMSSAKDHTYYLFADHAPVAKFVKASASKEVAALFPNEERLVAAFAGAVNASNGTVTKEIKESFGIQSLTVSMTVSSVIENEIHNRSQGAVDKVTAAATDYTEDFKQALSIASVGINKNFWKSSTNSVKASLVATLTSVGVHNAENMVEAAFELEGPDYLRTLLAKAVEISQKDISFRNELATAVADATFQNGYISSTEATLRTSIVNPVEARSNPEEIVEVANTLPKHSNVEPLAVVSSTDDDLGLKGRSLFGK